MSRYESLRRLLPASILGLSWLVLPAVQATERHFANVPPGFELEVLDPNADSQGRPAVELHREKDGSLQVVVPPVVLVHKYYYTGDRSFQAQMLPGGPTIIVVNHPKNGERCYIETNMMPGAPRVTYTGHDIIYDFGQHGMTVHFPIIGQPKVKYRSGLSVHQHIGHLVHADELKQHAVAFKEKAKFVTTSAHAAMHEVVIDTHSTLDGVLLQPVHQLLRVVPMASSWFDPDRHRLRAEKIAEHKRQKEAEWFQKQAALESLTLPTNR